MRCAHQLRQTRNVHLIETHLRGSGASRRRVDNLSGTIVSLHPPSVRAPAIACANGVYFNGPHRSHICLRPHYIWVCIVVVYLMAFRLPLSICDWRALAHVFMCVMWCVVLRPKERSLCLSCFAQVGVKGIRMQLTSLMLSPLVCVCACVYIRRPFTVHTESLCVFFWTTWIAIEALPKGIRSVDKRISRHTTCRARVASVRCNHHTHIDASYNLSTY